METIVQKLAGEMYDTFEESERSDGSKYTHLREGYPPWMMEVIRAGHDHDGEERGANNEDYETIQSACGFIHDSEEEFIDEFEVSGGGYYQISLNWLAAHVNNIEYLTGAMNELSPKDGWELITTAHHLYGQNVIRSVWEKLKEIAEEGEIMEKYGVKTNETEGEKTASAGDVMCPRCGKIAENHGGVLRCPKCGTEPFEKERGQDDDKKG